MNVVSGCAASVGGVCLALACNSGATSSPVPVAVAGSAALAGAGGGAAAGASALGGASSGGTNNSAGAGSGAGGSAGQPSRVPVLAVGPFASCATDAEQVVKCAGRCGAMGHGGSRAQAPAGLHARLLAVGRDFACGALPEPAGAVQCWGGGAAAEPPSLSDVVELVAGDDHACARSQQGTVSCWGNPAHAAPDALVAKQLAASGAMTCAITMDDALRCWGPRAVVPPAELRASSLAVSSALTDPMLGPRFGCAVTLTGDVRCFGDDVGKVQSVPVGLKAKRVALGRSNACAIGLDDTVTCWGTPARFGTPPPSTLAAAALSLAFRSAGAVTLDGTLALWGDLSDGRSSL